VFFYARTQGNAPTEGKASRWFIWVGATVRVWMPIQFEIGENSPGLQAGVWVSVGLWSPGGTADRASVVPPEVDLPSRPIPALKAGAFVEREMFGGALPFRRFNGSSSPPFNPPAASHAPGLA
jgi:hypothetical protein